MGSYGKLCPFLNHHLDDAIAATVQQPQCTHHTPATGGEEREIEPIQGMGMIDKGQWREFGQDTSTLYEKCHWIFNDHRESGPQFKDG